MRWRMRSAKVRVSSIFCADGSPTNTAGARRTAARTAEPFAARRSMPMHADLEAPLPAMPSRLRQVVLDCAQRDLPPNVGLMQIFMAAADANDARRALAAALACAERGGEQGATDRIRAMIDLWR